MQDFIIKVLTYLGVYALIAAVVIPLYKYEGFETVALMLLTAILAKLIIIEEK